MIEVLCLAGSYLEQHQTGTASEEQWLEEINAKFFDRFEENIRSEHLQNPWFTEDSIRTALSGLVLMLNKEKIEQWISNYQDLPVAANKQKTIGVVMAGNIPLVGFHDMLSILVSGHRFFGKPSSKDNTLIRLIAELLAELDPELKMRITFTDDYLKNADAQIATGSNNTSRYFEYYFKDIPHIIRKNRNSIAVLGGEENRATLVDIGRDIFTYFGLGCRNITKIYFPEDYDLEVFMEALEEYRHLYDHHKYANNIDYQRSVYLMNRESFLDNGALLLKESNQISSPVGVVFYEKYSELDSVRKAIDLQQEEIQCVVTMLDGFEGAVAPGRAQYPELWDYADGIDTLQFLNDISK